MTALAGAAPAVARLAEAAFAAFDVLPIEHGRIAEITTFGPELFPSFGLRPTL